jgi:hypothetical protein
MVLAGCTAHHDSAKKTPTATPTPEFTVDTTVSNQPKVSDAFGPALWQVDERTAGKAVAVLPSGGLLLDKDGRLTALSPDGRQEWTRQTATGTQRKKNGGVVTSVHMNSLLVNEGKVAASVENIRDVDTTGPNRTGVNLVLIDTANGKVISRVQLSGCGGSAPVSLGGLGFSTVCTKNKTDAHAVVVSPQGRVDTLPIDTSKVVNETPVATAASHGSVTGPSWLVTKLRADGGVDPHRARSVFTDGRDIAVVQAPALNAATDSEPVNVVVDFATKAVWRSPSCFVSDPTFSYQRSPDHKLIGVHALLIDRSAKKAACLEKAGTITTIRAISNDGTVLADDDDKAHQLLVIDPKGKRTLHSWQSWAPQAAGGGKVYTALSTAAGNRTVTAHELKR